MDKPRLSKPVEIGYLPARYLMQNRVRMRFRKSVGGGEKGLALDNNCNVGYPHGNCEPHNKLIFVPDGDAGEASMSASVGSRATEDWLGKMKGDVHSKNNQDGSGDEAHITKDLDYGCQEFFSKTEAYQEATH
jgi:hypothetical protein